MADSNHQARLSKETLQGQSLSSVLQLPVAVSAEASDVVFETTRSRRAQLGQEEDEDDDDDGLMWTGELKKLLLFVSLSPRTQTSHQDCLDIM